MPDSDRPRRPVPAWVTAPPEDAADPVPSTSVVTTGEGGTHGTSIPSAPGPTRESAAAWMADAGAHAEPIAVGPGVVPDFPPDEALLPPAPTSPAVDAVPFETAPFDTAAIAPRSPVDAPVSPEFAPPAAAGIPAPASPTVDTSASPGLGSPVVGQPRFSVPGLEHVVVAGVAPEPSGPIGYRTPARFAHQQVQAAARASTSASASAPVFPSSAAPVPPSPVVTGPVAPSAEMASPVAPSADVSSPVAPWRTAVSAPASAAPASTTASASTTTPASATASGSAPGPVGAGTPDGTAAAEPGSDRSAVRPTPAALLGAALGAGTLALAAWWFTVPGTVHGTGALLGVLALVLAIGVLRRRDTTWQRPVALLGAVLGGVGTAVLLWAVASALLPAAGIALPDLTGTGTVPTLVP